MKYKIVHVGGDPTKAAFLASDLSKEVRELQADGWEIDGVDLIEHEHGWDMSKQMYVKTQEYIIRAKYDDAAEKYAQARLEFIRRNSTYGLNLGDERLKEEWHHQ